MTTAVQKITLSASRNIPFNKLVLSQSNVRRVKAGVSSELSETTAADDKQHPSKDRRPLPLPHKGGAANATSAQTKCGNVTLSGHPGLLGGEDEPQKGPD